MFEDKNYVLGKIVERTHQYVCIVGRHNMKLLNNVHEINNAQGYAGGLVYETKDKKKYEIYCAYYLMGGLVRKINKNKNDRKRIQTA